MSGNFPTFKTSLKFGFLVQPFVTFCLLLVVANLQSLKLFLKSLKFVLRWRRLGSENMQVFFFDKMPLFT